MRFLVSFLLSKSCGPMSTLEAQRSPAIKKTRLTLFSLVLALFEFYYQDTLRATLV